MGGDIHKTSGEPLPITLILTAFQRFEWRDGDIGLDLVRKCGAAANRRPSVRKPRILYNSFNITTMMGMIRR
jgi:hypothetical protein